MTADTFPKLLKEKYERYGHRRVAMRQKKYGIWNQYTWQEVYTSVARFSAGLMALGLERGDKVAVIGDNDRHWYLAEFAVQAAGGTVAGVWTDSIPSEVQYIVDHCDARFVICQDQEQVDKILEIKSQLPKVCRVIYWEPKGMWDYDDPLLIVWDEVEALGVEYELVHPGCFERHLVQGSGNDIACICYTSGTSGRPKGVMSSFDALLGNYRAYTADIPWKTYISTFPVGYIVEQGGGIPALVDSGVIVNFPESRDTTLEDTIEIGPSATVALPRQWEELASRIRARIADSTLTKRAAFHLAMKIGYHKCFYEEKRQRQPLYLRAANKLADFLVFRPIRSQLGYPNLTHALIGGGLVGPDTFRFFRALGFNLLIVYGLSEMSGWNVYHRPGDVRYETVGRPGAAVQVMISDEGEVLLRGPGLFVGYHKDPEATARALRDGWFNSGDAGYFGQDGHLVIIDRAEDLRYLADGERFSPTFIENRVKFSPFIKDAVVLGGADRTYLAALICIDFDNVGKWLERQGITYTTFLDLSQRPEVYALVQRELEQVNGVLPPKTQLKRFVNLHKEFDPDEAELTRTRKLRRRFLEERYLDLVEAIYGGQREVTVEATVSYRDGRMGSIKTTLRVTAL